MQGIQILYIDGFIMRPPGGFVNSSRPENRRAVPAVRRGRRCRLKSQVFQIGGDGLAHEAGGAGAVAVQDL